MTDFGFCVSSALPRRLSVAGLVLIAGMLGLVRPAQAQQPLPPGSTLPSLDTALQPVRGGSAALQELTGDTATVILFWSNECPWVDKYESRVQALVKEYESDGVQFLLVNANDASTSAEESLDASRRRAENRGYEATYVRDRTAALARALGATRTPHVFVFDGSGTLVYEGAIDDSPGDPQRVESAYLEDAVTALVRGEEVPVSETKAFGCTLKYPEN